MSAVQPDRDPNPPRIQDAQHASIPKRPRRKGFRCVGSGGVGPQLIDVFGNAARHVDFATSPSGVGGGQLLTGATWKFQFWYRDPAAGGAGFNLSNGLSLTFTS